MDIDISAVHELWAAPKENWLDHFVNANRFKKLLNEENKSNEQKEELRNLVIQFAEQAVQVESETETLIKKQFGQEDIAFHERKASCLWLCCLASFSAIDWHFECLMEKPDDVIIINYIFDKIEKWKEYLTSPSSISFTTYLLSRWICFVFAYFRIAPPEAKQTVSNPCNQLDVALQRFDHAKSLVIKLRTRKDESLQKLEVITSEKKPLFVPRPHCFFGPFVQNGGLSLSIGILGDNVLVTEDTLRPQIPSGHPRDTIVLSIDEIVQKIHFELGSTFFCAGKMINAVGSLKQVVKSLSLSSSPSPHPLIRIDERKVNGFCAAFRIPPPYANALPPTSRDDVMGDATSADAYPRRASQRKYGTRRDRKAEEQARSRNLPLSSIRLDPLSLCEDVGRGGSVVGWREKMEKATVDRRGQVVECVRALCTPPASISLPPSKRSIVRGTARFMNAIGMGSQPLLDCLSIPPPTINLSGVGKMTQPNPPAPPAQIRAMAASDKPFWTILTSFDAAELQTAFQLEGNQYFRPAMLSRCPEVLAEVILRSRPVDELHALILGKMQQLTEMGDQGRWKSTLDSFVSILGGNATQAFIEMSIYEATRVQMLCLNRQLFSPHFNLKKTEVDMAHSVAKKLVKISQVNSLIPPMIGFLLNKSEFTFVCQNLDPDAGASNALLNVGKVIAAYGQLQMQMKVETAALQQLAKTWHALIAPYFEAYASKRRHDGYTTMHLRDSSRVRLDLIKLFEAIKQSTLQEFLISYFAGIYTQALAARGRAHLRIYASKSEMFTGLSLQLPHMESLDEMITLLLDRALSLEPHRPTLLRTKADFAYVRNELNEAGIVYCELLVALKPSISMPMPRQDGVIDDSVWNHLRICLRKNNQQTLAACVCQLFSTGRAKEYRKAAEAIQDRTCLDASDDCFGLIYDIQLAEALTDTYRKRGQQQKLESLLEVIGSPTMNLNNGKEAVDREIRRKQKRILNTLATLYIGIHS